MVCISVERYKMTGKSDEFDQTIRGEIADLTDFDTELLCRETALSDIGFDSLDFLSVQVALKRKNNLLIDLSDLAAARLMNYGALLDYLVDLERKQSL